MEMQEIEKKSSACRHSFPSWGDLLVLLGVWFLMQFVALEVARTVGFDPSALAVTDASAPLEVQRIIGGYNALTYAVTMGGLLLFALFYRRWRGGGDRLVRFAWRGLDPVLILWGVLMMASAGVVLEPLLSLLPEPASPNVGRGWWAILCVIGLAPLIEELLCRGVLLESARSKYGVVTALFLSSAFFAVLHFQPALVLNAFVMGVILGTVYIASDSILSVVVLHAVNNAVAFVLLMAGIGGEPLAELIPDRALYQLLYGVALLLFSGAGYMLFRTLRRARRNDKSSRAR